MTKEPDYEGALKAAIVAANQTAGALRYKVVDNANQLIALTRTKWTAHLLAKTLFKAGQGLHWVTDIDGVDEEEE